MKLQIKILLFLISLISISGETAELDPNIKALQIAESQPRIKTLMKSLQAEIETMTDPSLRTLRNDALQMLRQPIFSVVKARKKSESDIIQTLIQEKLFSSKETTESPSIFPKMDPMPFVAASGSPWLGHHSYPGGLVYHTLTNLSLGVNYSKTYQKIYGINLRNDLIRFVAVWHDAAKTMTLPWNSDGSCAKQETQIAGTSAHHILGVAEALYRRYPSEVIVILASAHNPPFEGQSLSDLLGYLKAGAIIAGVPYTSAGLTGDGKALASLPPIEAFVNHLDDHDYVLTQTSIVTVDKSLLVNEAKEAKTKANNYWKRDEILSRNGDLPLYHDLVKPAPSPMTFR